MALYGPNNGVIPFTGYSPTLGASDAVTGTTSGQIQFNGLMQDDGRISKLFRRPPNRAARELFLTLVGAAAGSTASETRARVAAVASPGDFLVGGGAVTIESVTLINRATTAADVTNTLAIFTRQSGPASYPADVSGNGGGGRAGI